MEERRYYRRRGTEELPISSLLIEAGISMVRYCHYHPEPEFVYIVRGSVQKRIGKDVVTMEAGKFYTIPPYEIHGIVAFSEDAVLRRMIFDPNAITMTPAHFFQKNFVTPLSENRLEMPRCITPDHPAYMVIREKMLELDTCKTYEPDYQPKRFGILMAICTALFPYCHTDTAQTRVQDPGNEAVRKTMRYINSYYRRRIDLQTLADNVHLHPNYLCALFKTYTGETVFQHLTRIRVESAAYLLREDDIPMNKVAEASGFNTESLFYQKFKQIMGITPSAYKKQHRKQQKDTSR
ncbi:MAG: helix-turn-helix domain-containing protein [Oscillospiraceae bacterium]|nr:helix-turn-helix domain-containing protein [Oscillospiraceae bacterium]